MTNINKKNIKNISRRFFIGSVIVVSLITTAFFVNPKIALAQDSQTSLDELNKEIQQKKQEQARLQKEIDAYQEQIVAKRQEVKNLNGQLALLGNQIAKVGLDIQSSEQLIAEINLEIQAINLEIKQTENSIKQAQDQISSFINLINHNDQIGYLEILLTKTSFAEWFDYLKYTQQLHSDLKKSMAKLLADQNELAIQKSNLEEKINQEEKQKDTLLQQRASLAEKSQAKGQLVIQTQLTQRQYQQYVNQLQSEQQQANSAIASMEKQVRTALEQKSTADRLAALGPARLSWPVDPSRGLTAVFHDPDYPFRYIFEHPAVDIRTPQGTTIKAPEAGYVGLIQFKGNKSYAYVLLIHSDGLSTVFGHISKPLVTANQFVTKGQAIALSGGAPGSIGSGGLTTGPHLHFEVRLDGIPVNPVVYLPSL